MGFWMQPKRTFLRRALFQIHLWTGIAVGLYMVFISLTGSAVVFRRDLNQSYLGNLPAKDVAADAKRLTEDQFRAAVRRQFPGYTVTRLAISRRSWKRINFDLRAALGLWGLLILFLWGVSGIYFGCPDPFLKFVDYFDRTTNTAGQRGGDVFIAWMVRMHFGRYGGMGVRITYVIIGLLPAVMFITGAVMWWNRVLRRWLADTRRVAPVSRAKPAVFPVQPAAE